MKINIPRPGSYAHVSLRVAEVSPAMAKANLPLQEN